MNIEDQNLIRKLEAEASELERHYNSKAKVRAEIMRRAAARIRELASR